MSIGQGACGAPGGSHAPVRHVPLHVRVPGDVKNVVGIVVRKPVRDGPRSNAPPWVRVGVPGGRCLVEARVGATR